LVFSYLAVRHVHFSTFGRGVRDSDPGWLALAFVTLAAGVFLRGVRWRYLFARPTRPPLGATQRALLIGYFFNNVLPGRAGEAIRVFTLHEEAGTSRAEALATAVTERLYDLLTLLAMLFIATPWLPAVAWLQRAILLTAVTVAVTAGLVLVLRHWGERGVGFLLRPLALLPFASTHGIAETADSVVRGLVAVRQARAVLLSVVMSIAAILTITCSFWLVMLSSGLHVGFGAAVLVMVATNIALLLPSSPAAVGVFEAATIAALASFHVNRSHALAYAVVLHGLNTFPFIVAGLILLVRRRDGRSARRATADRLLPGPVRGSAADDCVLAQTQDAEEEGAERSLKRNRH
jgi:uncharacterized protein (TIRG00374 family)